MQVCDIEGVGHLDRNSGERDSSERDRMEWNVTQLMIDSMKGLHQDMSHPSDCTAVK